MSDADQDELHDFVQENKAMLVRVLAYGDAEGRSYALAALANGGDINDSEEVQQMLDELKREARP